MSSAIVARQQVVEKQIEHVARKAARHGIGSAISSSMARVIRNKKRGSHGDSG
jgi:hypothetical protein